MAVYAIGFYHRTQLRCQFAKVVICFGMAAHALLRKKRQLVSLAGMYIVAGSTIHITHHKTFAAGQQAALVAMHIKPAGVCGLENVLQFYNLLNYHWA